MQTELKYRCWSCKKEGTVTISLGDIALSNWTPPPSKPAEPRKPVRAICPHCGKENMV